MLNDFYAVSYIEPDNEHALNELSNLFKYYTSNRSRKLFLSCFFNPSLNVSSNLLKAKYYYSQLKPIIPNNLSVSVIHTIPLMESISTMPELSRLAISHNGKNYIFIMIPPGISADIAVSEIHAILYKLHLTPVIISYELVRICSSEKLAESLSNIPNCIYQIGLSSLQSHETLRLVRSLYRNKKLIMFGSGTKFDAPLYANLEYYTKRIRIALGERNYGYFLLQHNKLF